MVSSVRQTVGNGEYFVPGQGHNNDGTPSCHWRCGNGSTVGNRGYREALHFSIDIGSSMV